MKETDAKYTLADPTEVMAFLTLLLKWGATPDNAWHTHHSCTGWSLKQPTPPDSAHPSPLDIKDQDSHVPDGTPDHAQEHQDHLQDDLHHPQRDQHIVKGSNVEAKREPAASLHSAWTPGHSPTAFARVRQFHGMSASSDRAMPASQWATKTDSLSHPKLESESAASEQPQADSGRESPYQSSAAGQAGDQEGHNEYGRLVGRETAGGRQVHTVSKAACGKQIEAEGRPPTGKEVHSSNDEEGGAEGAPTPAQRPSLDHYLCQPYKASEFGEGSGAGHMGRWDAGEGVMSAREVAHHSSSSLGGLAAVQEAQGSGQAGMASMPPVHSARPGQRMPEGKRLTALLLDKLQGHDAQRPGGNECVSPPGLSSNSTSSVPNGYQSPFESLANEGFSVSEDTDSIKAEIGSIASINLAPSG